MWFLAPKNFSAKSVKKWPKNGQNTSSRPKKVQKCGFWPRKNFQPNWSKNGQKMAKIRFLGPKRFKNVVFGPKNFSAKLVKKWPRNGQKTLSRPKKVQKCGFWPQKNFQPNRSKNGRNLAKRQFLGPKRFKNVVFGPEKNFSQIGQKMAETWPKDVF